MSREVKAVADAPRRGASPWRSVLLIVLALVAIVVLRKAEPSYKDKLAPLAVSGQREQRVEGRNFAVKVGNVKAARAYLVKGSYGQPDTLRLRTSGIWLSVVAEVEALQKPGYMSAQLRTRDGIVYPANDDDRPKLQGINLNERPVAVGLPEKGAYFFEIPPDKLQGLHLQVYWGNLTPPSMDSLADIDLGIDAAKQKELLAKAPAELDLRP